MLSIFQLLLDTDEKQRFMEELVEEYGALMLATARRYVSGDSAAEDIVQDSMVKLMRHVDKIMSLPRCNLSAYIVVTVRNAAFNYLRDEAVREKHVLASPLDTLDELAPEENTVEERLILADEKRQFRQVWSRLSEADRMLLERKYLLEETDAEIAEELGCKQDSVRMKLTRAKRRAAKLYDEGGNTL